MAIIINLDELMNKNGYTLTGLAEEIGITLANLSNLKNGKTFPSKDTLDNLCRVLNCQPGDILEYRLVVLKMLKNFLILLSICKTNQIVKFK